MSVINRARALRKKIEEVANTLPDERAVNYTDLFPKWSGDGVAYAIGARVRHEGALYKCLQTHTSQTTWRPDTATSVWAEVLAGQDGTEIGEWAQPDSANPYMSGDKVTHNGSTWESVVDNNVWEPGVYGWVQV